ncbi:MAG: polysaccharide biosynthesis/export family protein, partial [Tepidisphaeraceae bacterium]
MSDTESIEARLCAYVDGELDASGRAEIEAHLASSPEHRRLMDDLLQTRQWMHDLPRAAAPVDLSESMNAQLERSALLGGDDGGADALRLRYRPPVRAIAAVVLLTMVLAAAIYWILPSATPQPPTLATLRPEPASPSMPDPAPPTDTALAEARDPSLTTAPPGAATVLADAKSDSPKPAFEPAVLTVVVRTGNSSGAGAQLRELLAQNHIAFEPVSVASDELRKQLSTLDKDHQPSTTPSDTVAANEGSRFLMGGADLATPVAATEGGAVVARRLTRSQATMLCDAMSRMPGQNAELNEAPVKFTALPTPAERSGSRSHRILMREAAQADAAAPSTSPSRDALASGDVLRVTAHEEMSKSAESITRDLRIDEDGQLDVPGVGKFQAAGRTAGEIAESMAREQGLGNVQRSDAVTWTVEKVPPEMLLQQNIGFLPPSTEPVNADINAPRTVFSPQTQPAAIALGPMREQASELDRLQPQTQPAAPEPLVDVVFI